MYTLREVAERWQKSENDILRMAIEGEVVLSAWWSGIFLLETSRDRWVEPCNGLFEIKREIIGELLTCGESLEISSFENGAESIYFALEEPNRLVSFELTREKIVIDFAHLADAEAKHPELVAIRKDVATIKPNLQVKPVTATPDENRIESKTPFNQAIERLYRYLYDQGEYDAITPDYVDDFVKVLDKVIKQGKGPGVEFDNGLVGYIAERIEKVTISRNGTATIATTELQTEGPNGSKNIYKTNTYKKPAVTKKLCLLRKDYPLPLQIPIPHP